MPLAWPPDYDQVYRERTDRLAALRADPAMLAGVQEHYKTHPWDWINDWGMTIDQRLVDRGEPAEMPLVLFEKQTEFLKWLYERWRGREHALVEKSRDMGASWLCVAFAVWMWTYYPNSAVGFGSRKEEYVDKIGDPKSLFDKARYYIDSLPDEFRPKKYSRKTCAPFMRIVNPDNNAVIAGEAGDNIGRGARTSIYFVDEAAHLEHPDLVDAALSATTNCQVHVSSVAGNANPFYRKRHGGHWKVFVFDWHDDPRKNQAWYEKEKLMKSPVWVAQEIDRDYNAADESSFVSGTLIEAAMRNGPREVGGASGRWVIGIDAAHMGDDESVITARNGRLVLPQKFFSKMDGPDLAGAVSAFADELTVHLPIYAMVIELDGPGVSCYDTLKRGKYARYVRGIHTGGSVKNQRHYNKRAKLWDDALKWLKESPVSMPNDFELKAQLAALKYKYKDGLLLMEKKSEYKSRLGKSPDRADSFVLTFSEDEAADESRRQANGWDGYRPLSSTTGY